MTAIPKFEAGEAFNDLRDLMQKGRPPLALIGAGASLASGYPDWHGLLEALRKEAIDSHSDKTAWRKDVEDLNDALWTAEVLTRKFPKGALGKSIARQFGDHCGELDEPHLTLAKLRFPHFLTTNYDRCIERALDALGQAHQSISWEDDEAISSFLISLSNPTAERRVVHLHGRFDSPEDSIVLRESDYVKRYIASDDARRKLMAVFITHPVVFIGFSMNDPDLANLMREVTARLRSKTPCHFALMGYKNDGDREATRDRMSAKFGIRPVFFRRIPPEEGSNAEEFDNLVDLLDALAGLPERKTAELKKEKAEAKFDADDPNKGQFGGVSETPQRRLRVERRGGSKREGTLTLEFILEAKPDAPPLSGPVTFFLHPTFRPKAVSVQPKNGRAVLERWSYGAFTLGVRLEAEDLRLEYDLALDPHLPQWFRSR